MTTAAQNIADNRSYTIGPAFAKDNQLLLPEETCDPSVNSDEFIPVQQDATEPASKPSLKTRFKNHVCNFIDQIRSAWRQIRILNPFTHLLNFIEYIRCSKHLRAAKERNGAKTEEALKEYHRSLQFNPNNPCKKSLYRTHFSSNNKPKPLVVLFLGNNQNLLTPREQAGMNELYEKLKRNKNIDLVIFRVGEATCDIKHKWFMGDCSVHTNVVFEHTSNIIEDIINCKGQFRGRIKPSEALFLGYSFGGGTVDKILREKWGKIGGNIPVSSICIDPIKLGAYNLGCPVEERPPHSRKHIVFYQDNSTAINGTYQMGLKPGDICIKVPGANHDTIDNNENIHRYIQRRVRELK